MRMSISLPGLVPVLWDEAGFLYRVSVESVPSLAVIPVSREPRDSIRIHTGAIGVALKSIERGRLGAHVEGEASHFDRLREEDVDRVGEADAPACIDGCSIGLDLCGRASLRLGGAGCCRYGHSFRQLHYGPVWC